MNTTATINTRTIRPAAEIKSGAWFLRRALLGIVVLSVFVLGSACLLYAGIDSDEAATAADQADTHSE